MPEAAITFFLQFALLVFVAVLWYIARRDLTSVAAQRQARTISELHQVRETVERLLDVLDDRADAAEHRLAEALRLAEDRIGQIERGETIPPVDVPQVGSISQVADEPKPIVGRYRSVYELADSGISDPAEIARRAGLGLAEVEMVLNLRPRQ